MSFFNIFRKKSRLKLDYLLVGLGNPDEEYLKTRHNIGWMVIDRFISKHNIEISLNKSINGLFGTKIINNMNIGILKPTTYMNRSGLSISKAELYYEFDEDNIVIIVDEYNFPVNKIHLKIGGSDGGHNGISSILNFFPNNKFLRLRCGIDKNFGPGELVEYVLSSFEEEEENQLNNMIDNAVTALDFLFNNPLPKATSFINSGKLWENKDEPNKEN